MSQQDLEKAYRRTTYVALTSRGELRTRVGRPHPELDQLLVENNAETWAYITAWNPKSEPLGEQENHARQEKLEEELRDAGYAFFQGQGTADNGEWPPEDSVLVVGIPRQEAVSIGVRYAQNAIVYGRLGEAAVLVWCVADGKAHGEGRDVYWKGVEPELDIAAWLSELVAELADELGQLGQVETDEQPVIRVLGESFVLRVRLWLSPFPSDDRVEARIAWSFEGEGVDGQTDVQPDDSMAFARQHVLEEVRWGLSQLSDTH